jgi:hypothetical protein
VVGNAVLKCSATIVKALTKHLCAFDHRWVRLLEEQTSITIHRLPTKKNKLPFSVCSKQTEVAIFH